MGPDSTTISRLADDYRGLGPALGPEADGQRTDLFLARGFPFQSRGQWRNACRLGHLLVNGRPVRPAHRLKAGDRLTIFHPLTAEPDVDEGIELVAEAPGIIAVAKPANLPMHESGFYRRKTFGALLARHFGPEWAPVHRLDRETSGILVCAATPDLRRKLSIAFEEQRVEKRYQAMVIGAVPWTDQIVDQPLGLAPPPGRPRYIVTPHGMPARTDFTLRAAKPNASWLEARPRTGRTNQIRAHAAWLGFPLVGDKIYHPNPRVYAAYTRDGDTPAVQELAGFPRHALHAGEVCLVHPETGYEFRAAAPLRHDLQNLWNNF
jgi:23S rRNA pseudouridine1911/1915/1917 synthase